ncbi:MAG: septum formation initiator [Novosphingobium sp.]
MKLKRQGRVQALALVALLLIGGLAVAGPSGFLAWSDNLRMLDQRQQELRQIQIERDDLHNRVALLDPRNTDPDLAGELLRRNLNVVHQDEMVLLLK